MYVNITNIILKRLRIKLIEEFKEWSEKFRYIEVKFRYDDFHSVWLSWMHEDRYVSLHHDLSKTVKYYRRDYTDIPVPILRALIKYFKDRKRIEEKKKLKRNEKIKVSIGKENS